MGIRSYSLHHAVFAGLGALALGLGLTQAAHAQQITRDGWRMNRASPPIETPDFASPSGGHPESFRHAPPIPAANDPAWEPAPDSAIIAFRGHDGDEQSRLPDGTCRNAFDYVFFDTVVTVPDGATANTFTMAFIGMDDGSRVTIFNADYPDGTPDMAEGLNNFVAQTENANQASTTDLVRFLRPGANRVVITQVDDCPAENRLKRADVVVNGVAVGAVPAMPAEMSGGTGAAVAGLLGGMAADTAVPEVGLMAAEDAPSIVSAYGDVHFRTFSNIAYDIQTPGEYYLAGFGQSADFAEGLQIRVSELEGKPGTAVVTAISGKIGGAHAEVYLGARPAETAFYVNGKPVELEYVPENTGAGYVDFHYGIIPDLSMAVATGLDENGKHMAMIKTGDQWFLSSRNMETGDAEVRLNAQYGWTTGLMGNMQNPNRDALVLRDGSTIALPASDADLQRYAESWRVASADSYFVSRPQVLPPVAPAVTLADLPQAVRIEAAASCLREGVTEARLLRDCTLDVGKTGNPAFAASAADVQAALDATPDAPPVVVASGTDPIEEIGPAVVAVAKAIVAEETGRQAEVLPMPDFAPAAEGTATVSSYGDVHLRNHAGVKFDVPQTGDFILSEHGIDAARAIPLQVRHGQWKGQPGTSVLTAIAMQYQGISLEIYLGDGTEKPEVFTRGHKTEPSDISSIFDINGNPLPSDYYGQLSPNIFVMGEVRDGFSEISVAFGQGIQYRDILMFNVRQNIETGVVDLSVDPRFGNAGLLGSGSAPRTDALLLRDGAAVLLPAGKAEIVRFAESWRVDADQSLFKTRPLPAPVPEAPAIGLADIPAEIRQEAALACMREGVNDASLLRDCTLDVGKTGNPGFAKSAGHVQDVLDANPNAPAAVVATGIDPMEEIGPDLVFAALMVLQEEDAARVAGTDAAPQAAPEIPKVTSLQSCSVGNAVCTTATDQGFFMQAGEGDRGRISEYSADAAKPVLEVEHVPLDGGATAIAIRDAAGRYLRVSPQDFTVSFVGTSATEPEALFLSVPALDSPGAGFASFRSLAFPERFLRHAGYVLFVDLRPTGGDQMLFNRDASWRIVTTEGN